MNCEFAEKVSLLLDGELSESESQKVRTHIARCTECRDAEKDFLFLREQIKKSATDFVAERTKAPVFQNAKRFAFWKKAVSLPVPVFAVLLFVLAGLSVWLIAARVNQNGKSVVENPAKVSPAKFENQSEAASIARFDKGGRAEIYVSRRDRRNR